MAEKLISRPRDFPAVEELLQRSSLAKAIARVPRPYAAQIVKQVIADAKEKLRTKKVSMTQADLEGEITRQIELAKRQEMTRVINATGVVVHTNLGRAPLSPDMFERIKDIVTGYGNVEYDLSGGKRGGRGAACERYLSLLAGSESGAVVNNNAAALLLILNSLANRKEVLVSRGELVQIGGGFRIPDILRKSGARLVEVGTTNITTLQDYEDSITDRTGLVLKVHKSNFAQAGFTDEADIAALVKLGRDREIPVVNDLGSGVFIPTRKILGQSEPTVQQSVRAGADLTCFSGDKMLGGAQAGLIVGREALIKKLKRNPLFRTMRLDKIMFALLEGLLSIYLEGNASERIKLWQVLSVRESELYARGRRILDELGRPDGLTVAATRAFVGGGALPEADLPSAGIVFEAAYRPTQLMNKFRRMDPPVIGRIENERFVLDLKAVAEDELAVLSKAIRRAIR